MYKERVMEAMREVFQELPVGIDHTLRVLHHAEEIMDGERVGQEERELISLTAILHDIGIMEALRKYNSISGSYQEQEGPAVARNILRGLGYDPAKTERVCHIIGNHHTPARIDGLDFQIQWEADLLENLQVMEIRHEREKLTHFIETNFKTLTGRAMAHRRFNAALDETRENLRRAYDNYLQDEANHHNEIPVWHTELRAAFLEMIMAEGKQTLLDIGAGMGDDAKFFEEHGFAVTAIDLSGEMIKRCKEQGLRAFEYDLYDLSRLGERFDAMWALNSLIHIEKANLPKVLREIRQTLNPGGLIFISLYGGEESEGVLEGDLFTPQRYFSFYSGERIQEIVAEYFELVRFEKVDNGRKYHIQGLFLRKR